MELNFKSIVDNFCVQGDLVSCERYGEGHINQTYLLLLDDKGVKTQYILQKINDKIFKDVDKLMQNIKRITEFCRSKIIKKDGNPDRESLSLVYAKDGKAYFYDKQSQGYFRIYKFITQAIAYQVVEKPEHFYESAVAFGKFANLLAEFDASSLYEVIENFHNTKSRFNDFKLSLSLDKLGRAKGVEKEIQFVLDRENYCGKIVDLLESGKMPLRVTHNDTKLNNVMIDEQSGKSVAVIDLDTIMPGSLCYDFGDSIRFGCNPCLEDEKDLSKVNFDIGLFEQYVKGYLYAVGKSITPVEKDNLVMGALLMTYECGMRFLTDYLDGDIYFRVKRENHNLDRARTQFKLLADMEGLYDKMIEVVNKY